MPPCHYFHVTVTAPEELREALRANQRDGYALLMKAAAEAIIDIAPRSPLRRGTVGVLAVLHTWTQQLNYHPTCTHSSRAVASVATAPIGIPHALPSLPRDGHRQARAPKAQGVVCTKVSRSDRPHDRLDHPVGSQDHPLGRGWRRRSE